MFDCCLREKGDVKFYITFPRFQNINIVYAYPQREALVGPEGNREPFARPQGHKDLS